MSRVYDRSTRRRWHVSSIIHAMAGMTLPELAQLQRACAAAVRKAEHDEFERKREQACERAALERHQKAA